MDNVCHTLVGAAMGEAGLKRLTGYGNATLMIASNIPDLDALVFLTGVPSVSFRRGWTHGVLAQAVLPILLTGAVIWFDQWRSAKRGTAPTARAGPLLALCYIAVLVHVGLDFLNNYGIRLLMPFSGRWFYGDAVFIVDPWLWLMFGAGIAWARRRLTTTPARVALGVACIYIAGMLWLAASSRAVVLDAWRMAHGADPRALMVGPVPLNPLRKQIIVDVGSRYETGTLEWWPRRVRFDRETVPKNDEFIMAARARRNPRVQAVLVWTRFPYYEIRSSGDTAVVTLRDLRFGDAVGATRVEVGGR
jgi:inner membrane protein